MHDEQRRYIGLAPALVAAVALLLAGAALALAAAADLDPTFGAGGKLVTPITTGSDHLAAAALQPDGKIIVAGDAFDGSTIKFGLIRHNPDGALDATFDGDGKVIASAGSTNDHLSAIAIQPDGRIVAVGSRDNGVDPDFVVVRYNPDGSPDLSFDGDGVQFTPIGTNADVAFDVAIQTDGKIVVAGRSYGGGFNDTAVARYNADGSLDTTFGSGGKVVESIVADHDHALAVALQPDGKIVITGFATTAGTKDFAFIRLNADGSLDATFDGDGRLVLPVGTGDDIARGLVLQPDGKLVAVGESFTGTYDVALIRLNADGTPDTGFDGDGKVTTAPGPVGDFGYDVGLQFNGKIVVVGAVFNGSNYDTALMRYNPDGSPDATFDGDGVLISPNGAANDFGNALAIQPDGKIVVAGDSLVVVGNYDFGVQRFIGDPPPPPAPTAKILAPSKKTLKRRRLRAVKGTAGPAGQVAKVEIALRRFDKKLLKRRRCLWLKNNRAKFARSKAKGKKCAKPRFLKATGRESWSYRLKRVPAKGRYELFVRVTLTNGARHESFSAAAGNRMRFLLR